MSDIIQSLPFGMKNGQLVHISTVESGLECGCHCPECKNVLVARKGDKNKHHFAHKAELDGLSINCKYAEETIAHKLAKEVLLNSREVLFPSIEIPNTKFKNFRPKIGPILTARKLNYTEVEVEKANRDVGKSGGVRPDVAIYRDGVKCYIEITVTHGSNHKKIKKLETLGVPTFEIILQKEDINLSEEEFKQKVLNDVSCRKWVYNPVIKKTTDSMDGLAEGVKIDIEKGMVTKCVCVPKTTYVGPRELCYCTGGEDPSGNSILPCYYFRGIASTEDGRFSLVMCYGDLQDTRVGKVEREMGDELKAYAWK